MLEDANPTQQATAGSTTTVTQPPTENVDDNSLEIKDAAIIFNHVWTKIVKKWGTEQLRFPKEIIWLMGAPGAGKSYNAAWILRARGITAKEVVMSSLLTSPEAERVLCCN